MNKPMDDCCGQGRVISNEAMPVKVIRLTYRGRGVLDTCCQPEEGSASLVETVTGDTVLIPPKEAVPALANAGGDGRR